jgi:hypothetical protein
MQNDQCKMQNLRSALNILHLSFFAFFIFQPTGSRFANAVLRP